jgi:hypothetical protein
VAKATGNGHFTGVTSWLTYSANAIVTAMVAVSFGSYAASTFAEGNQVWIKVFAALIILVMTGVNIVGSSLVANAQTVIVYIVLGILSVFAVVTLVNMTPSLLAPSKYPPFQDIISSVALTFFAFLGFGIITFTAKDLPRPSRQLPRAMFLAQGIGILGGLSVGPSDWAPGTFVSSPPEDPRVLVVNTERMLGPRFLSGGATCRSQKTSSASCGRSSGRCMRMIRSSRVASAPVIRESAMGASSCRSCSGS